jgi:adenine-specific DNA methylase
VSERDVRRETEAAKISDTEKPLAWAPCFIESQFPVAKVSMESYKERKANYSQTLTGLGKWWGRKPLVLIRATLLGLLMPASDNPVKDRETFLKLMTMDEEGLWRRKDKTIPRNRLIDELIQMPESIRNRFLDPETPPNKPKLRSNLSRDDKLELQRLVFQGMPYSEKLKFCCRPEQIDGPSPEAWREINAHLGTSALSLQELVEELGIRRFGRRPRVGDSFCGAGSVPFEAARLGCDAYGSDLSPVAALLTWAALNIVGGGDKVARRVRKAQEKIFDAVDKQITEWGIEHNELGWRADAFLYCVEVRDPESGWMVPLAPSWVIGEKTCTVAKLVPDINRKRYRIEIHEGVSHEEMKAAKESGTVKNSRLIPPDGGPSTPIEIIRRNLRMWENEDIVPRPDDVFKERLYCIQWVETYYEMDQDGETAELSKCQAESLADFNELLESGKLKEKKRRHYCEPTEKDLAREQEVQDLLRERFKEWQSNGYIPSRKIEPGDKTDEPIRTRGWTHWHHLFTPRQLLLGGLISSFGWKSSPHDLRATGKLLTIGRYVDWNSKLCRWHPHGANEKTEQTFSNQALNTLSSYASRSLSSLKTTWFTDFPSSNHTGEREIAALDARQIQKAADVWITDPPYADAINYHELSEFFLSWYEKHLPKIFPDWHVDSKRAIAIKGSDGTFRQSMVESYRRMAEHMPENGLQVVMFTHQDASVWADLTLILWAAGLRVTSAWCIATETESALKQGNYVQGTVLLVLRKRTDEDSTFLDEMIPKVESEVKRQMDSMMALEDESDPNFGDADFQLAAYAAALRVLTEKPIEEIDPAKEILRQRRPEEANPVEKLIRNAVKIACDHLVPRGIEADIWKSLSAIERFFLKGLEVESHGEYRSGVYQELARGYGAADYSALLASTEANQTRLKTALEIGRRMLSGDGFPRSLVRQLLFAVHQIVKSEETRDGLNWLKTELPDYWQLKEKIINLLEFIASLGRVSTMPQWKKDAEAASLLCGAVRNDHV